MLLFVESPSCLVGLSESLESQDLSSRCCIIPYMCTRLHTRNGILQLRHVWHFSFTGVINVRLMELKQGSKEYFFAH